VSCEVLIIAIDISLLYLPHSVRKETAYVNAAAFFRAGNDGFFLVSIALFNLLTFVTYTLTTGSPLTPNIIFTSLTLVTGLRLSTIVYMVEGILGMQEARIALHRIQVCTKFMPSQEASDYCTKCNIFSYIALMQLPL